MITDQRPTLAKEQIRRLSAVWWTVLIGMGLLMMAHGTSANGPDNRKFWSGSAPSLQITPTFVLMFAQVGDTTTIPSSTVLNIANGGEGTLDWEAKSSHDWITITPISGSAPGQLTVTYANIGAMTTGTVMYNGAVTVSATTSGTANTPQVIPVTFEVITTIYKLYMPICANGSLTPTITPITPTDPYYNMQWGLAQVQAGMAWNLSTGSPSVTIAVLDSGVDTTHPDLSSKLVTGHNFANGSDDENYQDNCGSYTGHGTHVAGIAAAATNNGIGVAGLGWDTRIMPVKVLGGSSCTGSDEDVIRGIEWAVSHGAQVINLSLGGSFSSTIYDPVTTRAFYSGTLVVAAAGNCGDANYSLYGCDSQNEVFSPAGNAYVLGVAATDSNDERASFSSVNTTVDIAAPGVSIYSTVPGGYGHKRGTSMATPFVSGLAALVYARFPSYTPTQVAQAIVANADLAGSQTGWSPQYGCGRINAYRTLANGAVGSCAGWSGLATVGLKAAQDSVLTPGRDYVPGQVLIVLRPDSDHVQAQKMAARHGFAVSEIASRWRVYRLSVPVGKEQAALAMLRAEPAVEAASLNGIVRPR